MKYRVLHFLLVVCLLLCSIVPSAFAVDGGTITRLDIKGAEYFHISELKGLSDITVTEQNDTICLAEDGLEVCLSANSRYVFRNGCVVAVLNTEPVFLNGEYDDDICYLVYAVSSSGENGILYIDALNGEYVGRDIVMAETGFAVAIQESANSTAYNYNSDLDGYTATEIAQFNSWRIDKMTWAASAMRRLGYSATSSSYTTSAMITDVQDYLSALGNEYAFYFSGHGNSSLLGFKRNGWIRTSDVDGNWHFVFLDACQTAVDTGWADAFNINGYNDRAYLGWNGNIQWGNGYLFAEEFWPLINGTNTVRQAAVDAAALVPGSGTTPIKFYGDTSYTGEAWS